jgi:methyltransferase (TIGR00027 family)
MADVPKGPSRTAILTAVARDLYRQTSAPLILDDHLAAGLAGEDGVVLGRRLERDVPPRLLTAFCRWTCVRSRVTEDLVADCVGRGADQYVILGAGLDSFAYRRPELLDRARVFEVDHPASQSWKRQRLRDLGIDVSDNVVFAAVDFERQTLDEGLTAAGFAFDRAAVFSWIGVTMYLTSDAIRTTLRTVASCAPRTTLVLTYNQPHHVLDDHARDVAEAFGGIATGMGEPFLSLFIPDQIAGLLRTEGFVQLRDFGPAEARATYFQGIRDVEMGGAQRLLIGAVGDRS